MHAGDLTGQVGDTDVLLKGTQGRTEVFQVLYHCVCGAFTLVPD